jgi:pimeloyl-ACP methyl ester carboxylesterase
LDWTDFTDGEHDGEHSARWLIAESWWAEAFVPPKLCDIFRYAPIAVPLTLVSHAWGASQTYVEGGKLHNILKEIQYALHLWFWIGASIFAAPLVYLLLSATQVFSWIPSSKFQSAATALRAALIGVLGDAVVFAKDPSTRAALVGQVERDLSSLAGQCKSVLLVGHSQGAMLAYLTCRARPSNVKGLLTLGSAIRTLRTLIHATEREHDWDRNKLQLATAQLAAMGALITVVTVMVGVLPLGAGVVLGSACLGLALATGLLGISNLATEPLTSPVADEFWRSRMSAEGLRWLDLAASHDPLATHLKDEFIAVGNGEFHFEPKFVLPGIGMPTTRVITNRRSMLRDHISYLANREECVSALVSLCAAFDGSGSDRWVAPHAVDVGRSPGMGLDDPSTEGRNVSKIGFARGHIVKRACLFRRYIFVVIIAFVALLRLDLLRALARLLLTRPPLRQIGYALWSVLQVNDIALAIVAVSAVLAGGSAARYALRRLTIALLERRNPSQLNRYGAISSGEWFGLAISGFVPLLLLLVLWRYLNNWTLVITILIATLSAHFVGSWLRLFCSRRERSRAFSTR